MSTIIRHFDTLTALGLRVIPLRENSKVPLSKGWNREWDSNKIRYILSQRPDANLGLLLGEIVDVEGDSDRANAFIVDLIGDYPHPCYKSSKSIHHLFLTPDATLRICKHGKIEFRGYGHQSVLPPSQHQGITYRWLPQYHFPVPEMPPRLLEFYESVRHPHRDRIKPGHVRVYCSACGSKCFLHRKRFEVEVLAFRSFEQDWQCHSCRKLDLRPTCRRLRGSVRTT